jgi:hypothetical protein
MILGRLMILTRLEKQYHVRTLLSGLRLLKKSLRVPLVQL